MAKYIKRDKKTGDVETDNPDFLTLVNIIQKTLRSPRKRLSKPFQEGELLVEFIRALTKESTKSFRSEFAGLMGLKEAGLNSVLYQRNITGKHLANILLQLANVTAEEFVSEFLIYLIEKRMKGDPEEWFKIFMQLKHLTDEEKKYIAMMALKFDDIIDARIKK